MPKLNKNKNKSILSKEKPSVGTLRENLNFKISFQYFDSTQEPASSFQDWEKEKMLSKAMDTLKNYCSRPLREQIGDNFTIYNSFPSKDKTRFFHPSHVPEDAHWARIHVNGKHIIVGHVVNDTFYVVFLDSEHKFYLTKRVTGK